MIIAAQIRDGLEIADDADAAPLPWWSFGKTALAAGVFRLAEQNILALDEPLDGKPFTLRELLGHRAGVCDYGDLVEYHQAVARGERAWPVDELLTRVHSDALLFAPGSGWHYSNIGYLFVRQQIERATDMPLSAVLQSTIFKPLRISAFMPEAHDTKRLGWPSSHSYDPNWVYHGLIAGTALDAARFLDRLMTGKLLSDVSRKAMLASVPLPYAITGRPCIRPMCGTGLMIDPEGPLGPWIGHTGAGPGSVSAVYYFPQTGRTVAIFSDDLNVGEAECMVLERAAT